MENCRSKNPFSQRTKTINNLNYSFAIAMTGTPFENSLSDLWSISNILKNGYLMFCIKASHINICLVICFLFLNACGSGKTNSGLTLNVSNPTTTHLASYSLTPSTMHHYLSSLN